jgi:hypothetical protein
MGAVEFMDSASYHKNLMNPWPVAGGKDANGKPCWQRANVIDWLKKRGEELGKVLITDAQCEPAGRGKTGLTMVQLFPIVKANLPTPHYEVYDIAAKYGHRILFTPPYSPLSNPIEKIWAVIKNKVACGEERPNNLTELARYWRGLLSKSLARLGWVVIKICYENRQRAAVARQLSIGS